jgi:ABC-2 type transport system ATP-binding protein
MSELEALLMERGAGHVVIIGRGRVIADTSVADLSLSSERVVAILTEHAVVFTEITAHRATLEEAYMELTRESVEFRAEATS